MLSADSIKRAHSVDVPNIMLITKVGVQINKNTMF